MHRHTIILKLMCIHTKDKELKKPCKTRFASQFLMHHSILEVEDGLRLMVASPEWRAMDYSKTPAAFRVTEIIQSTGFWNEGKEVQSVLEALVIILRLVNGDGSSLKLRVSNDPAKYVKLWSYLIQEEMQIYFIKCMRRQHI